MDVDEDSTAGVQNVVSDETLASRSAEGVTSSTDLPSPDSHVISSTVSSSSSSDDADTIAEAKTDADVEVMITQSSVAAAEFIAEDSHAFDDKDQSSTEVQHDEYSAGSVSSSLTHDGRSVLPESVYC